MEWFQMVHEPRRLVCRYLRDAVFSFRLCTGSGETIEKSCDITRCPLRIFYPKAKSKLNQVVDMLLSFSGK